MVPQSLGKILAGLAFLGLLSGCVPVFEEESGTGSSTAAMGNTIIIGSLLPLSGEGADYGLPAQRVIQIAAKKINAAGGIKGKQVELLFEDGACGADSANKAATKLVSEDKVKVIIGGFCSSETLAAAPIVEQNKVVLLSPASSSPKITEAGDFIFRNYPSDSAQGEALGDYAVSKAFKNVGIIVEEQPYTEGIADSFTGVFTKKGGKTTIEKYTTDASEFRTQITKLQAAKVDAYFIDPQTPNKADLIVKQLVEAGVKGPFLMNDVAIGAKDTVTKYAAELEGTVGAEVPYDKMNPDLPWLQEEYKTLAGGKELPYLPYMAPAYDTLFIVKEAIETAGEDPIKIKDYLYTVKNRKGLAGTLSFDKNGDPTAEYRHALRIVKKGVVEDYAPPAAMAK